MSVTITDDCKDISRPTPKPVRTFEEAFKDYRE